MTSLSDQLPLTPLTMAILIALGRRDLHGYALMKEVERQTAGALRPGTGSLYTALQRLSDSGWIQESTEPPAGEDARRKYYRITPEGREIAAAEARRMTRVLTVYEKSRPTDRASIPETT